MALLVTGEPAPSPLWIPSVCAVDAQLSSVQPAPQLGTPQLGDGRPDGLPLDGVVRSRVVQTCPEVAKLSVE